MTSTLRSSTLWSSALRTERLALHNSSRPNPALSRALSIPTNPSPDSPPPFSKSRPTPPHLANPSSNSLPTSPKSRQTSPLEFPPIGPISYSSIPNPLLAAKPTALKNAPAPPKYHFYGVFSKNNSKVFLCGPDGKLLPNGWWSAGKCGFKGANRKTHEAGYQCGVRAFKRLEEIVAEKGRISIAVHFTGLGKGRSAVEGVFLTTEGEGIRPYVVEIEDRTNIKIGGTRAKKRRRV